MALIKDFRYGGCLTGPEEREALIASIDNSIATGNWQQGEQGKLFEEELSEYLGIKHAVLTSSGSCAGLLALLALELPHGSEVIISAVTFPTIFNIILQCGLVPVVVDATVGTYNFDVDEVEKAITKKTKAIIGISALGNPVDWPKLRKLVKNQEVKRQIALNESHIDKEEHKQIFIAYERLMASKRERERAKKISSPTSHSGYWEWAAMKIINNGVKENNRIFTILDNCDGLSTKINDKFVEQYADISFTSLHAAHIISCGVGGIVFTNDKKLAENVRMYRDWGRQANTTKPNKYKSLPKDYNPRFIYEKIGYNFQILDLQAAMGRVQLRKIEEVKKARKANFEYLVSNLGRFKDLVMPYWVDGADVCWFAFPLTYNGDRGKLTKHLEAAGIETRSMFSGNIIKHPAYQDSYYRVSGKLKESDYILKHSFWITCHPRLTKEDLDYIIDAFKTFFA